MSDNELEVQNSPEREYSYEFFYLFIYNAIKIILFDNYTYIIGLIL